MGGLRSYLSKQSPCGISGRSFSPSPPRSEEGHAEAHAFRVFEERLGPRVDCPPPLAEPYCVVWRRPCPAFLSGAWFWCGVCRSLKGDVRDWLHNDLDDVRFLDVLVLNASRR